MFDVLRRDGVEAHGFREVLADEAVGVLDRWSQVVGQFFQVFKWSLCRWRVIHGAARASLATNANARHGG